MMYAINDRVFYGGIGVCRIIAIDSLAFGAAELQDYYVLQSQGTDSLNYVATGSEAQLSHMRHLLSREEILGLIQGMPQEDTAWPENERKRAELFAATLRAPDCHALIRLVCTLYREQDCKRGAGKRLTYADTRVMDTAERLLHEEFAFVLGLPEEEVSPFIKAQLACNAECQRA